MQNLRRKGSKRGHKKPRKRNEKQNLQCDDFTGFSTKEFQGSCSEAVYSTHFLAEKVKQEKRLEKELFTIDGLTCLKCDLTFSSVPHLHIHKIFCGNGNLFLPGKTSLRPEHEVLLREHTSGMLACPWCPKLSCSMYMLEKHLSSCREAYKSTRINQTLSLKEDLPCPECFSKFKDIKTLLFHLQTHYLGDLMCFPCQKLFARRALLIEHLSKCNSVASHKCSDCCRLFRDSKSFKTHVANCNVFMQCLKCACMSLKRDVSLDHMEEHLKQEWMDMGFQVVDGCLQQSKDVPVVDCHFREPLLCSSLNSWNSNHLKRKVIDFERSKKTHGNQPTSNNFPDASCIEVDSIESDSSEGDIFIIENPSHFGSEEVKPNNSTGTISVNSRSGNSVVDSMSPSVPSESSIHSAQSSDFFLPAECTPSSNDSEDGFHLTVVNVEGAANLFDWDDCETSNGVGDADKDSNAQEVIEIKSDIVISSSDDGDVSNDASDRPASSVDLIMCSDTSSGDVGISSIPSEDEVFPVSSRTKENETILVDESSNEGGTSVNCHNGTTISQENQNFIAISDSSDVSFSDCSEDMPSQFNRSSNLEKKCTGNKSGSEKTMSKSPHKIKLLKSKTHNTDPSTKEVSCSNLSKSRKLRNNLKKKDPSYDEDLLTEELTLIPDASVSSTALKKSRMKRNFFPLVEHTYALKDCHKVPISKSFKQQKVPRVQKGQNVQEEDNKKVKTHHKSSTDTQVPSVTIPSVNKQMPTKPNRRKAKGKVLGSEKSLDSVASQKNAKNLDLLSASFEEIIRSELFSFNKASPQYPHNDSQSVVKDKPDSVGLILENCADADAVSSQESNSSVMNCEIYNKYLALDLSRSNETLLQEHSTQGSMKPVSLNDVIVDEPDHNPTIYLNEDLKGLSDCLVPENTSHPVIESTVAPDSLSLASSLLSAQTPTNSGASNQSPSSHTSTSAVLHGLLSEKSLPPLKKFKIGKQTFLPTKFAPISIPLTNTDCSTRSSSESICAPSLQSKHLITSTSSLEKILAPISKVSVDSKTANRQNHQKSLAASYKDFNEPQPAYSNISLSASKTDGAFRLPKNGFSIAIPCTKPAGVEVGHAALREVNLLKSSSVNPLLLPFTVFSPRSGMKWQGTKSSSSARRNHVWTQYTKVKTISPDTFTPQTAVCVKETPALAMIHQRAKGINGSVCFTKPPPSVVFCNPNSNMASAQRNPISVSYAARAPDVLLSGVPQENLQLTNIRQELPSVFRNNEFPIVNKEESSGSSKSLTNVLSSKKGLQGFQVYLVTTNVSTLETKISTLNSVKHVEGLMKADGICEATPPGLEDKSIKSSNLVSPHDLSVFNDSAVVKNFNVEQPCLEKDAFDCPFSDIVKDNTKRYEEVIALQPSAPHSIAGDTSCEKKSDDVSQPCELNLEENPIPLAKSKQLTEVISTTNNTQQNSSQTCNKENSLPSESKVKPSDEKKLDTEDKIVKSGRKKVHKSTREGLLKVLQATMPTLSKYSLVLMESSSDEEVENDCTDELNTLPARSPHHSPAITSKDQTLDSSLPNGHSEVVHDLAEKDFCLEFLNNGSVLSDSHQNLNTKYTASRDVSSANFHNNSSSIVEQRANVVQQKLQRERCSASVFNFQEAHLGNMSITPSLSDDKSTKEASLQDTSSQMALCEVLSNGETSSISSHNCVDNEGICVGNADTLVTDQQSYKPLMEDKPCQMANAAQQILQPERSSAIISNFQEAQQNNLSTKPSLTDDKNSMEATFKDISCQMAHCEELSIGVTSSLTSGVDHDDPYVGTADTLVTNETCRKSFIKDKAGQMAPSEVSIPVLHTEHPDGKDLSTERSSVLVTDPQYLNENNPQDILFNSKTSQNVPLINLIKFGSASLAVDHDVPSHGEQSSKCGLIDLGKINTTSDILEPHVLHQNDSSPVLLVSDQGKMSDTSIDCSATDAQQKMETTSNCGLLPREQKRDAAIQFPNCTTYKYGDQTAAIENKNVKMNKLCHLQEKDNLCHLDKRFDLNSPHEIASTTSNGNETKRTSPIPLTVSANSNHVVNNVASCQSPTKQNLLASSALGSLTISNSLSSIGNNQRLDDGKGTSSNIRHGNVVEEKSSSSDARTESQENNRTSSHNGIQTSSAKDLNVSVLKSYFDPVTSNVNKSPAGQDMHDLKGLENAIHALPTKNQCIEMNTSCHDVAKSNTSPNKKVSTVIPGSLGLISLIYTKSRKLFPRRTTNIFRQLMLQLNSIRRRPFGRETVDSKTKRRNLRCWHCGFWFQSKAHLDCHECILKIWSKKVCGEMNCEETKKHDGRVNTKRRQSKGFTCLDCNNAFCNFTLFKQHRMQAHAEDEHLICPICKKEFDLIQKLAVHYSRSHPTAMVLPVHPSFSVSADQSNAYEYTGVGSKNASHVPITNMRKRQKFSCSVCCHSFSKKAQLKLHLKQHKTLRKFLCPCCSTSFSYKNYKSILHFNGHVAECKGKEEDPNSSSNPTTSLYQKHCTEVGSNFICSLCCLTFSAKTSLCVHIFNTHWERGQHEKRKKDKISNKKDFLKVADDIKIKIEPVVLKKEEPLKQFKSLEKGNHAKEPKSLEKEQINCKGLTLLQREEHLKDCRFLSEHSVMDSKSKESNQTPFSSPGCSLSQEPSAPVPICQDSVSEPCVCPECYKVFKSMVALSQHLHRQHGTSEKVVCPFCKRKFNHEIILQCHQEKMHKGRTFQSPVASSLKESVSCLISNVDHTTPKTGVLLLTHQSNAASDISDLTTNSDSSASSYTLSSPSLEGDVKCLYCYKTFSGSSILQSHMCVARQKKLKFKCRSCGLNFKSGSALSAHDCSVRNREINRTGDSCNSIPIVGKDHLNEQQLNATSSESPCFPCKHPICATAENSCLDCIGIQNSERSITEVADPMDRNTSFACADCHMSYKIYSCLKRHRIQVHKEASKFNCSVCAKGFSYPHTLKIHMQSLHRNSSVKKDDLLHITDVKNDCFINRGEGAFQLKNEPKFDPIKGEESLMVPDNFSSNTKVEDSSAFKCDLTIPLQYKMEASPEGSKSAQSMSLSCKPSLMDLVTLTEYFDSFYSPSVAQPILDDSLSSAFVSSESSQHLNNACHSTPDYSGERKSVEDLGGNSIVHCSVCGFGVSSVAALQDHYANHVTSDDQSGLVL